MKRKNEGFLLVDAMVCICIVSLVSLLVIYCVQSHTSVKERIDYEWIRENEMIEDAFYGVSIDKEGVYSLTIY